MLLLLQELLQLELYRELLRLEHVRGLVDLLERSLQDRFLFHVLIYELLEMRLHAHQKFLQLLQEQVLLLLELQLLELELQVLLL